MCVFSVWQMMGIYSRIRVYPILGVSLNSQRIKDYQKWHCKSDTLQSLGFPTFFFFFLWKWTITDIYSHLVKQFSILAFSASFFFFLFLLIFEKTYLTTWTTRVNLCITLFSFSLHLAKKLFILLVLIQLVHQELCQTVTCKWSLMFLLTPTRTHIIILQ